MAKQKVNANAGATPTPPPAETKPEEDENKVPVNPIIESAEEVIQHLENAHASLLILSEKLRASEQSNERAVRCQRAINDILRDLKPYITG